MYTLLRSGDLVKNAVVNLKKNTQLIETIMKSRLLILLTLTAAVYLASCQATGVTIDELAERLERIERAVLKFAHVVSYQFTYHKKL